MATTVAAVNKSAGAKKAAALAKKKTQVAQDAADILQAMNVVTPQVVNEPSRDNYTAPVPAPKQVTPSPAQANYTPVPTNYAPVPANTVVPSSASTVVTPNAPTGNEQNGFEMSQELRDLYAKLNGTPSYTPKTDDEIRAMAEGEYSAYYDQLRRAATMAQERGDLALAQQIEGLQSSYDKMRESTQKSYDRAYSQSDRQMLSRGMQRSSYAAQTLANLLQEGAEAQGRIDEEQLTQEGNLNAQRTQLAEQLAAQLEGYDADEAKDILARVRQLQEREQELGIEDARYQNEIATQLYSLLNAERGRYEDRAERAEERDYNRAYQERRDIILDTLNNRQLALQELSQQQSNTNTNRSLDIQERAQESNERNADRSYNLQERAQTSNEKNADRSYALQERAQNFSEQNANRSYELQERAQTHSEEQAAIANQQWAQSFAQQVLSNNREYDLKVQQLAQAALDSERELTLKEKQLAQSILSDDRNYNLSERQFAQTVLNNDRSYALQERQLANTEEQNEFARNMQREQLALSQKELELNQKKLDEEIRQFDIKNPQNSSSSSSSSSSANKTGTPTSANTTTHTASNYAEYMNLMDRGVPSATGTKTTLSDVFRSNPVLNSLANDIKKNPVLNNLANDLKNGLKKK